MAYHVVPHGNRWGVKHEGKSRMSYTSRIKRNAIARAKQIARNKNVDHVMIHGADGRAQRKIQV